MIPFSIVVPYRDRAGHLAHFIKHMRQRFTPERAEILIVEQCRGKGFNRGKLLNIGFLNARGESDYYAFHDVDMLPTKADYSAPVNPTHIATRVSQFRYKMPFAEYFGGVTLFTRAQFIQCNGYSNDFWTWGAEDNELYDAVLRSGQTIDRRQCTFESLHHLPADRSQHAENCAKWDVISKHGRQPGDGVLGTEYGLIEEIVFPGQYKKIIVEI